VEVLNGMRNVSLYLLIGAMLAPATGSAEESVSRTELTADEIRAQRNFRSESTAMDHVSKAKYFWEPLWVPARATLDYSERTDLLNRTRDLFYFNDAQTAGWFPNVSFSSEEEIRGIGFSLFNHDLLHKGHEFDFSMLFGETSEIVLKSELQFFPTETFPFRSIIYAEYFKDRRIRFWETTDSEGNPQLGSDTRESDAKRYAGRRADGGLRLGKTTTSNLYLTAHVRGFEMRTESQNPELADLPGLDDTVGMMGGGLGMFLDRRDDRIRPSRGALLDVKAELMDSVHSDSGDDFRYTRFDVNSEIFVPLWHPHRVFVLRQYLARTEPLDGKEIPFYEFPVLDYEHRLRSYDKNRFQDQGALAFSFDYRYPVWRRWDAFLFFDTGQVFEDYSDITSSAFRQSYGLGARGSSKDKLQLVIRYAYGDDGSRFDVFLDQKL